MLTWLLGAVGISGRYRCRCWWRRRWHIEVGREIQRVLQTAVLDVTKRSLNDDYITICSTGGGHNARCGCVRRCVRCNSHPRARSGRLGHQLQIVVPCRLLRRRRRSLVGAARNTNTQLRRRRGIDCHWRRFYHRNGAVSASNTRTTVNNQDASSGSCRRCRSQDTGFTDET